jgi:molybdopterin synthase catalytic subunit
VGACLTALEGRHPTIRVLRSHLRAAVNQEFASESAVLADGDEVALIPPVAGGADALVRVQDRELSLDEVVRAVIKGDEARARSLMHDLLGRRSGVVLSQLAPQPLQQLGRLSLSRGAPRRAATATATSERGRARKRKR